MAFDLSRAVLLARAARAAYFDDVASIDSLLARSNVQGTVELFALGESEGFHFRDEDQFIVAFRGSQTLGDWAHNADRELVNWDGSGKVHRGFWAALSDALTEITTPLADFSKGRTVWFCGHSLGGAMAILLADWAKKTLGITADGVFTYGAPKVGDAEFAAAFDAEFAELSCCFQAEGDPIPFLPMLNRDFTSCGCGWYLTNNGRVTQRPSELLAGLLLINSFLDQTMDDLLQAKPHSKENYLHMVEQLQA